MQVAHKINNELNFAFNNMFSPVNKYETHDDALENLLIRMKLISAKGKRLRGALVYYSYLLYSGKDIEEILKASVFVELMHTHILMMDDIIDEDEKRRGHPTLHKFFMDEHVRNGLKKNARHFGESMAICASLMLSYATQNVFLNTNFSADIKIKALDNYFHKLLLTGYGEILDVLSEVKNKVSIDEAMKINLFKTAIYTYESPLHLGAILAGATTKDLTLLSEYSIPIGIAFQIKDDILGMFGDEKKLGKPVGSDLREGKMNILTIYTLEHSSVKDRKIFSNLLGNKNITIDDIDTARRIIKSSGALEYAQNLISQYSKKAMSSLNKIESQNDSAKKFLEWIIEYTVNRKY